MQDVGYKQADINTSNHINKIKTLRCQQAVFNICKT